MIDGQQVKSTKTYDVVNPHVPSKVLHQVSAANEKDIELALDTAWDAYLKWKETSMV
jgi:acyl-CoA reductase-like NAD-dependent aldehyde dehydrogenase